MILKYIYSIFLAVLVVTFVGVGIAAFYTGPKAPDYSVPMVTPIDKPSSQSAQTLENQRKFETEQKQFMLNNEKYNKNVSTIAIVASLIILAVSILFLNKILYLSDGLLLGGVFTLVYAIIRGFGSGDEKFRFLIVSIGLFVAVFLGYWKFVRNEKKKLVN